MRNFKDLINEEKSEEQILSKVAKKVLKGYFKGIVDQGDGYYTITLDTDIIEYKDIKALEINLSSFEIDSIDFNDADILVRKK
jgi:hypothetical protein